MQTPYIQFGQDGTTKITAEPGKAGPSDTDLKVTEGPGYLILANRRTAVKVLNAKGHKVQNLSPILGVRTGFVLFRARQARMQAEQARWEAEQRLQQLEAAKPRPRR